MSIATHDAYAAWRVPAYRNYIVASLLVLLGGGMQGVATGWLVYDRSGQALSLAWVGLAQALPLLTLTLVGGYLADRFDRRRLMQWGVLGIGTAAFCLYVAARAGAGLGWFYAILAFDSSCRALIWPARASILPQLLPKDLFESGIKWRTSTHQVAGMLGPALGGLVAAWHLPAAYGFNGLAQFGFCLILARLPLREQVRMAHKAGVLEEFAQGVRFVYRQKLILSAISLDMFAVLLGGAVFLLPIYAKDILHVGQAGLGWLRAMPAAGALVGGLLLAHMPPLRRAGWALLTAVAGFGVVTIIFGLTRQYAVALFALGLTGFFDNVSVVVRHTLIQLQTPDHMRGRVSAVSQVFIGASNELGGLESGLVAHWLGPVVSVVSGGIGSLLVVLGVGALSPSLRRLDALAAGPEAKA